MKPFSHLTYRGQLVRIRTLAREILSQYAIDVSHFDLIGHDTNTIYRVYARDGSQYALRVARPGWRDLEAANSEAMWLQALAGDTAIPVPTIIPTKNHQSVAIGQIDAYRSNSLGHSLDTKVCR